MSAALSVAAEHLLVLIERSPGCNGYWYATQTTAFLPAIRELMEAGRVLWQHAPGADLFTTHYAPVQR